MVHLQILCVGRLKERFYAEAAAEYEKRLRAYCRLEITQLEEERLPRNPSPAQIEGALSREGQAILAKVPPRARLIALCIEGRMYSSEELARRLSGPGGERLTFVIGGSYGLHPSVKAAAGSTLSLSSLTFPHHLARIMLLEQLYRGFQILGGGSYHK